MVQAANSGSGSAPTIFLPSPVVRLYLASALQRLEFEDRWPILGNLAQHREDVDDHNIPRMLWFTFGPSFSMK